MHNKHLQPIRQPPAPRSLSLWAVGWLMWSVGRRSEIYEHVRREDSSPRSQGTWARYRGRTARWSEPGIPSPRMCPCTRTISNPGTRSHPLGNASLGSASEAFPRSSRPSTPNRGSCHNDGVRSRSLGQYWRLQCKSVSSSPHPARTSNDYRRGSYRVDSQPSEIRRPTRVCS